MTPQKSYFKIGKVADMIGIAVSTLHYWEKEFEQLDPPRSEKGTRKYRTEDVEICKMIKHLLREKGYSLEYAKKKLNEFYAAGKLDAEEPAFSCKSSTDALRLLSEIKIKCEGDVYAVARIEAVMGFLGSCTDI